MNVAGSRRQVNGTGTARANVMNGGVPLALTARDCA